MTCCNERGIIYAFNNLSGLPSYISKNLIIPEAAMVSKG
jgi:hypothetical protein